LVTSPNIDAGKSSVAGNLASVIAQGGKKVVLVDADLRKPSLHEYFNLENDYGLSGIFLNGLSINEAIKSPDHEKLHVITSGQPPPNPSELLSSDGMDLILGRLKELYDFIIVDSPPSIVADAIDLGSKVDGVLIVIRPGFTRRKFAKATLEQFAMSNSRILGVVLNRIPQKELVAYGGYDYYSPNYSEGNDSEGETKLDLQGYLQKYIGGIMARLSR
jgi:capsular exopolysaccharide synthesis family protein